MTESRELRAGERGASNLARRPPSQPKAKAKVAIEVARRELRRRTVVPIEAGGTW